MLLAIRHARTDLNEDGQERLRGNLPVPLSPEGQQESLQTAQTLARLKLPIASLQSSPLPRAMQTAQAVSGVLRVPVQPAEGLRDWNVGMLAGQSVMDTLPLIHKYLDHPEIAPPQGESYGAFVQRVQPVLQQLIQDPKLHAVVTHNRVLTLLNAMTQDDPKLLKEKGPVEPAGAVLVKPDMSMNVLFGARQEANDTQPPRV